MENPVTWTMVSCEDFEKRVNKLQKKWPQEIKNVLLNLRTTHQALEAGAKSEQLKKLGFVHSEPSEILALDERGPRKGGGKPKPFRLYVYANDRTKELYVLTLGDKDTQSEDLRLCKAFVGGLALSSVTRPSSTPPLPTESVPPSRSEE